MIRETSDFKVGAMVSLRRSVKRQSPSGPHHFVAPPDLRSALAVGAAKLPGLQQATMMSVADASLRQSSCALAGCGKPQADPIHWAAEPKGE
jgi:hypothetical protein